jgi:hypothetical protein
MSAPAPATTSPVAATPTCQQQADGEAAYDSFVMCCTFMCIGLCGILASGTGKTPNGKMAPSAYFMWAIAACCGISFLKALVDYAKQKMKKCS